ncbi:MAG: lysophospholipid acyltransferase family protein [Bacteroidales bacterium]
MSKFISSVLYGLMYLASLLPLKFFYVVSNVMAFMFHYIFRYRRSVIDINIARSFPELKYWEFRKLRTEYYRYMCDIGMESIWALTATEGQLCKLIEVKNPQVLDDISARYNKVVVVMAHCGNWEILSGMCGDSSKRGPNSFGWNNIMLAYKAAENGIFDTLFTKMRMAEYAKVKNGGMPIESKRIVRHILKNKEEKGIYVFIADQSPLPGERVVTRFLHQHSLMISGPEYVARKLNLPVVYLNMSRLKRGEYKIEFTTIVEDAGKTEHGFVTREYAKLLESDIFNNKYNWLWSHKRWKRDLTQQEREEYNGLYNKNE